MVSEKSPKSMMLVFVFSKYFNSEKSLVNHFGLNGKLSKNPTSTRNRFQFELRKRKFEKKLPSFGESAIEDDKC